MFCPTRRRLKPIKATSPSKPKKLPRPILPLNAHVRTWIGSGFAVPVEGVVESGPDERGFYTIRLNPEYHELAQCRAVIGDGTKAVLLRSEARADSPSAQVEQSQPALAA